MTFKEQVVSKKECMCSSQIEGSLKKDNSFKSDKSSNSNQDSRKIIYLNGLDCANCALKIEESIKKLDGLKNVSVDFSNQTVIIEAKSSTKLSSLVNASVKLINEIEPDVRVSFVQHDKEQDDTSSKNIKKISLIGGGILFILGLVFEFNEFITLIIFLSAYIMVGGEVILRALKNITKGKIFDENFLMTIATIGAFLIGEYPEGVAVMLFYQIGEALQSRAVNNSRKSIAKIMNIKADFANLKIKDEVYEVAPEIVNIDDLIIVKPGEKVPLDGVVVKGESMVDMSALNGEPIPKKIRINDEIFSGSINQNGLLHVRVTKKFSDSTVSKILNLIQNASSKKAKTENFITKFAKYYTPFVVFFALFLALIPPLVIDGAMFSDWIYRALVFLVISCPCALVISIPLSFFGGIGGASKSGILIKGSNYLEALSSVNTIVFDKTGTLTNGVFNVVKINSANNFSKDELLFFAAHAESFSNHPIALSILREYSSKIDKSKIDSQEEIAGYGVKSMVDGLEVLVGNEKLMINNNVDFEPNSEEGTIVYISVDKKFAGSLVIFDEIKQDSIKAVQELKQIGIENIVMLSGDNAKAANYIANKIGISKVYSNLFPHEKVQILEEIINKNSKNKKVAFVGDGINDAPSLARADVGIAMGGIGSDAAIEAADIVLMKDEPSKIVSAIKISQKTKKIVWQNITFALGVKVVLLICGAFGVATMWEAVFGDVGVTLIAVLNAMRAMKKV